MLNPNGRTQVSPYSSVWANTVAIGKLVSCHVEGLVASLAMIARFFSLLERQKSIEYSWAESNFALYKRCVVSSVIVPRLYFELAPPDRIRTPPMIGLTTSSALFPPSLSHSYSACPSIIR